MSGQEKLAVGLIGAGKVGVVLASALARAGHTITAVWDAVPAAVATAKDALGRFAAPAEPTGVSDLSAVVLLAVPDDVLADLVEKLATDGGERWRGRVVIHVSGRYGVSVLDPLASVGALPVAMHPAMAFSGDRVTEVQRVVGARFAVTAGDPEQALVKSLVHEMGGIPFSVAETDRMLYHAAMAHASNHLVTLMVQSMTMLTVVGVDDPADVIGPAVYAALSNVLEKGFGGATGPVVRGDVGTVGGHIRAIRAMSPTSLDSYRVLSKATADYAVDMERVTKGVYAKIMAELY